MAANPPPTQYVIRAFGAGNVQVFPLLTTQVLDAQIGSDVGTGGPALALLEAYQDGMYYNSRVVEFRDDLYCITGDNLGGTTGVYKLNYPSAGQWGRVCSPGTGLSFDSENAHTGLHIVHPNGVPTLVFAAFVSNNTVHVYSTTDGVSGDAWVDTGGVFVETAGIAGGGQGIARVWRDSLVWLRRTIAAELALYDFRLNNFTSYSTGAVLLSSIECSRYTMEIHDDTIFVFGRSVNGAWMALGRLQGGVVVMAHDFTTVGTDDVDAQAAMFSDPLSNDLIIFFVSGSDVHCYSVADATGAATPTDRTGSVFGAVDDPLRPGKYLSGNSSFTTRRKFRVVTDSFSAPGSPPRVFIYTWDGIFPGGDFECWEWKGQLAEIEIVAGGAGIDAGVFIIPDNSLGGGAQFPSSARVELGDKYNNPQVATGGTRVYFRGYGSAGASTLTFRGGPQGEVPTTVVPIVGGTLNVVDTFQDGLEGYYKFDGDGLDSSPNGRDLNLVGAVPFVAGLIGQAADVPGAGSNYWIRPGDDDVFDFNQGYAPFTISVWANTDTLPGATACIVSKGWWVAGNQGWSITINSAGDLTAGGNTGGLFVTAAAAISAGAGWQHICLVGYGGLSVELFVDGVSAGTASASAWTATIRELQVGNRDALDQPYDGQIDELSLWSRALYSDEITLIYNAGAGYELSNGGTATPPTTPAISGNTITNLTPDNGRSLYSVVLDVDAPGVDITEGTFGVIIPEIA